MTKVMTNFKNEIYKRLEKLIIESRLSTQRKEINKLYAGSVTNNEGKAIKKLSDFHISFIDLLMEKNDTLYQLYFDELKIQAKKYFEDDVDSDVNVETDIGFYELIIPNEKDGDDWEIHFTTELQEEIFHVFFNGWTFEEIAISS
jgi:hypothetical protein